MLNISEQFTSASKANFDAQLAILTTLTSKAFDGVEKLVELNINTAKSSLEDSAAVAKELLAAKDPQEFFSLTSAKAQPNAEKAVAYGRQFATIAAATQAEFTKAAEAQTAEASRKVIALVDDVAKNAPAGSENAIAILKSAIGNANAGLEQITKSTKQAVETLESTLNNAVSQFTQAAEKTTSRAKK
jgi:phasin family protein